MCYSPIKVKNPNYGREPTKYPNFLKDCTSQYILMNCGHCAECIALEQMYLIQRIQMEALNNWLYMGTVTYKNETLPRLITSTGYIYRYTDYKDVYDMIRRLKKNNSFGYPFRYIYVTERGGKFGRPHAHFIFLFRKSDIGNNYEDARNFEYENKWTLFNEWKRVTKKGRYSESEMLSEYRESYRNGIKHCTYDFHFVDPRLTKSGITDVAFYVLKYMMKAEDETSYGSAWEQRVNRALKLNLSEEEYKATWDTIKSRKRSSLFFGLDIWEQDNHDYTIIEHLRKGIEDSKKTSLYPLYFAPEQILTFPLCPYYKGNGLIYDTKDALDFYYKNDTPQSSVDNYYSQNKEITQSIKKMHDYERKLKIIEKEIFSDTAEELYNI